MLVAQRDWADYGKNVDKLIDSSGVSITDYNNNKKLLKKYTSLTGKDIVDLLIEYPDIYIVTDSKHNDKININLQFSQLVWYAMKSGNIDVLNRIVVQIYNEPMLDTVLGIYPFKSIIYTLYNTNDSDEQILRFCIANNISVVTISKSKLTKDLVEMFTQQNISVLTHTVNDFNDYLLYKEMGVTGIYTDFILPNDFVSN